MLSVFGESAVVVSGGEGAEVTEMDRGSEGAGDAVSRITDALIEPGVCATVATGVVGPGDAAVAGVTGDAGAAGVTGDAAAAGVIGDAAAAGEAGAAAGVTGDVDDALDEAGLALAVVAVSAPDSDDPFEVGATTPPAARATRSAFSGSGAGFSSEGSLRGADAGVPGRTGTGSTREDVGVSASRSERSVIDGGTVDSVVGESSPSAGMWSPPSRPSKSPETLPTKYQRLSLGRRIRCSAVNFP